MGSPKQGKKGSFSLEELLIVATVQHVVMGTMSLYLLLSARSRNTGFTEYTFRRVLDGINPAVLTQISGGRVGTMGRQTFDVIAKLEIHNI